MKITHISTFCCLVHSISGFWDLGTTTESPWWRVDELTLQTSRFRWQRTEHNFFKWIFPWWDWQDIQFRRRSYVVAGVSYGMINLSTGTILNRRTVITAANHLDPYMNEARNLRIWALGRTGENNTPYRYRVWRLTRIMPRSLNPEHQHGPWGYHSPKDDITIVHTLDQMYVHYKFPGSYSYAYRAFLLPNNRLTNLIWYAGCGFEYLAHIRENYKIFYHITAKSHLKVCSKFIPKMWGRFICIENNIKFPCVQNGGPLLDNEWIAGVGSFEIRYNDESYLVFTDLRYYMKLIYTYAEIKPGEYYEYAYPQWSVASTWLNEALGYFGSGNNPYIPTLNIKDELYPLGKKK